MNIGEVAQQAGLTLSRVRFYERVGLLRAEEREANGNCRYPANAVLVLKLIAFAQKAGFTLAELRSLLPSELDAWEQGALLSTLHRKVQDIEVQQARLAGSKARLVELMAQVEAGASGIEDEDVASVRVAPSATWLKVLDEAVPPLRAVRSELSWP